MRQEPSVGLVLGSALPPESILSTAAAAERLGFQELWLAEDYFFTGGISAAAAVLASTSKVPVGLGVISGLVRHPAVLSMEIATLARMFPHRFMPGIGLGLPDWLNQMGLRPAKPLSALRESVTMVKDLLSGSDVSEDDKHFKAAGVQLAYAPAIRPPLYLGVVGPKMLQLAGEIADGTILSVLASPAYVSWSRAQIRAGAERGGREGPHRVVTFALANIDTDRERARRDIRELLAFYLRAMVGTAVTTIPGIDDELRELTSDAANTLAQDMPDAWLDELAVAGDPDECLVRIRRLLDAGSDAVTLFCAPARRADETIRLTAREILPKI